MTYTPKVSKSGMYRYQRQAINTCGISFPVNEYVLEMRPQTETSLHLPVDLHCLDGPEIPLTGGLPETFNGQRGIYSGPGVEAGVFYPSLAGTGRHIITYSPPPDADCPSPSTAIMTVLESVYVDPMPDHVVLPGNGIRLNPKTNAIYFSWDRSSPGLDDYGSATPTATPVSTTVYRLTVADAAGCEQSALVTVKVLDPLAIPTGFTPNGDGVNDVWDIEGLGAYPNVFVQVFNRWGSVVFSSKGYPTAWDGQFNGTPLPAATYYYTLTSDVLERPLTGAVTLLR